jgi:hypothetical protein
MERYVGYLEAQTVSAEMHPVEKMPPQPTRLAEAELPTPRIGFLGESDFEEWKAQHVEYVCKSGSCQHALKPKCRCGCKGSGHRAAILRRNRSIEEWLDNEPSPPLGIWN